MLVTQARYVAPDISGVSKSRVKTLVSGQLKKDLNSSYRPSKHLETFLLKRFPPRMSPNVFERNEVKIYKDECCGEFYPMFFLIMSKKRCRTSKIFAGPVDEH